MNTQTYIYHAFGLNIRSDLELPSLQPIKKYEHIDVNIKLGHVSTTGLDEPNNSTPFFQTSKNNLWLHTPDIARFLVSNGSTITVDPSENSDAQSVRLFLLGSCLGAILHQRKFLVLHGNAIRFGEHCIVFAGASGRGKSTLAAAFYQRGHDILTDDVCAIDQNGYVYPGYPQIKLWYDTLKHLEVDHKDLTKIRLQVEKFAYPIKNGFAQKPLPLKAVYILSAHNRDEFLFDEIKGMEKFLPLKNQTYRKAYLDGMELTAQHLQLCGKISGGTRLTRITRPNHGFQLPELVERIQADLKEHGLNP